ncbi:MAG: hypothetical protein ACOX1V_01605 [Candidatus Iainarchaeum sp.]|jgi:small subunit ribosomal protein S4e
MGKKGQYKRTKIWSMPKVVNTSRKETAWTVTPKPGPHTKETSVALGIVIRNYTGIVKTMKEVKKILANNEVKVNGVVRKSHQFPVGLFDVVSIPKQKLFYRMVFDEKGRLVLATVENEPKTKISKVTKKVMTKKGVQVTTNDSRTFIGVKANVGDSLQITLPEGKVSEVIEFKEGNLAYVTKGARCSQIAKIVELIKGAERKEELVKLQKGKEEFETIPRNVIIVGKSKVGVEVLN